MKTLSNKFPFAASFVLVLGGVVACSGPASDTAESSTEDAQVARDDAAIAAVAPTFEAENASAEVFTTPDASDVPQLEESEVAPTEAELAELTPTDSGEATLSAATKLVCKKWSWTAKPVAKNGLPRLGVTKVNVDTRGCMNKSAKIGTFKTQLIAYNGANRELFMYRIEQGFNVDHRAIQLTKINIGHSKNDSFSAEMKPLSKGAKASWVVYSPAQFKARNSAISVAATRELHARGIRTTGGGGGGCARGVASAVGGAIGVVGCFFVSVFTWGAASVCAGVAGAAAAAGIGDAVDSC
jgi:hypothetical protein